MEAIIRRLKRDKRGVSNVIVVMLSLILIVIIVANVVLWSYQMNQFDWEKMQENIEILNVIPPPTNWLSGWNYRKTHVIQNATGAGNNYQVRITVHYGTGTDSGEHVYLNEHCKTDFGDVRFTDDNGTTLLDYWMESYTIGDHAVFWVKIADNLDNTSATIYIYYGNSAAITTSNGTNTFEFFDDMESGESKWNKTGLWHITEKKSYSSTHSFWYGQEATDNYDTGTANSGELKTDQLTSIPSAKLELWYWREVESYPAPPYDQTVIYDSVDGSTWNQIWYEDCTYESEKTWTFLSINLSQGAKHLRFFFNTVDRLFNNYWGWFIDDVRVRKYVDPEPSHGAWGNEETYKLTLELRNEGSLTVHLVSVWVINSTFHKRYDIDFFINSGDTSSLSISSNTIPNNYYMVKVVTERGNIAVYVVE